MEPQREVESQREVVTLSALFVFAEGFFKASCKYTAKIAHFYSGRLLAQLSAIDFCLGCE